MTIRELNLQELVLVSGGLTLPPDYAPIKWIPLPKWLPPIPHPIDPIAFDKIFKNKAIK